VNLPPHTPLELILLFGWIVGIFWLINRKQIRILKKLAPHFAGSLAIYSLFLPALEGLYNGLKFYIHVSPKALESPGTLKFRLYIRSFVRLRILGRSLLVRAVGKTGMFPEVKTGDPAFDAQFSVFASQAGIAASFLQHLEKRHALQQMFDYGFYMLVIDEHGLWAEKLNYDRNRDLELTRVSAVLEILRLLGTGI